MRLQRPFGAPAPKDSGERRGRNFLEKSFSPEPRSIYDRTELQQILTKHIIIKVFEDSKETFSKKFLWPPEALPILWGRGPTWVLVLLG
jgi:hypothetical protein